MPQPEPVLIVGLSGRALAESARRAGMAPVVLDAFADLDTRAVAAAAVQVPLDRSWRFRRGALLAAARSAAPAGTPLVWTSGFERTPGLLEALAEGRPLWGCDAPTVRAVKSPVLFARAACRLGVPHPEISLAPPARPLGWLVKRAGAAGGGHVRRAEAKVLAGRGWYWQRRVPGRPVSVLVAGDGSQAEALAVSGQWAAPGHRRPFRFGGAMAPATVPEATLASLREAAAALAASFKIVGVASVDALVDGSRFWVLEVNPRPGAALEAYELAHGVSLFDRHRRACLGELAGPLPAAERVAGTAIVHARRAVEAPGASDWPEWAGDLTPAGVPVGAAQPICTVRATGASGEAVRALLEARTADILERCERCEGRALRRGACRRTSGAAASRDAPRATARP